MTLFMYLRDTKILTSFTAGSPQLQQVTLIRWSETVPNAVHRGGQMEMQMDITRCNIRTVQGMVYNPQPYHPVSSPTGSMGLCDFDHLWPIKGHLAVKWLPSDADTKPAITSLLLTPDTGIFYARIEVLVPQQVKCFNINGNFVEVWSVPSVTHGPRIHQSQNKVLSLQVFVNLCILISFVHWSRKHKVRKKWSKLRHDELHSATVGAGINLNSKLAQSG
jgi:hypothetical protein